MLSWRVVGGWGVVVVICLVGLVSWLVLVEVGYCLVLERRGWMCFSPFFFGGSGGGGGNSRRDRLLIGW